MNERPARAGGPMSVVILLCAALAACSSAPGDDEVAEAVKAAYKGATLGALTPEKVEKLGCEKSGAAYLCDVNITVVLAGKAVSQAARVRMMKSSKGWVAAFQR